MVWKAFLIFLIYVPGQVITWKEQILDLSATRLLLYFWAILPLSYPKQIVEWLSFPNLIIRHYNSQFYILPSEIVIWLFFVFFWGGVSLKKFSGKKNGHKSMNGALETSDLVTHFAVIKESSLLKWGRKVGFWKNKMSSVFLAYTQASSCHLWLGQFLSQS